MSRVDGNGMCVGDLAGPLDASATIGWEAMRRIEEPLLEMVERGITRAVEAHCSR
jgi:hypothetical protein